MKDEDFAAFNMPDHVKQTMLASITEEVEVWQEHWQPLQVMLAMGTQWRIGMNGCTGLDYSAIPPVLKYCGVSKKNRARVFECVREIEREMLNHWAKKD